MSTTLSQQLEEFLAGWLQRVPADRRATMERHIAHLSATGIGRNAKQVGDRAPEIILPDVHGQPFDVATLRATGPAIVTFYRGGWCPYCNLQLRAYQAVLPDIAARGATLVAISPQTPDFTLSTVQEKGLGFPVLSDGGNHVARRYGLVFVLSEALQELQKKFGNEVPRFNGDDSWELPMPGTFIVSKEGIVRLASVDSDYRRRLEPAAILACLADLG